MSLQYTVGILLLTCSLCVPGQTTFERSRSQSPFANGPYDLAAGDAQLGDGPHTPFERMQNELARTAPAFPADSEPPGSPGTVSVGELRNQPPKTELSLLKRAALYAQASDHDTAIRVLKRGLADGGSMPNARGMLGIEYLKTGNVRAAVKQLQIAVELAPSHAVNFANLGFALCLLGDLQGGERAVREAIKLDKEAPQSHFVLGLILLDRWAPEARDELMRAQSQVDRARLALAIDYEHRGETEPAGRQIQAYLLNHPSVDSAGTKIWVALAATLDRPSVAFGFPSALE